MASVNCVLSEPTLAHCTFPDPPGPEAFSHYSQLIEDSREFFLMGYEGHLFEVAWVLFLIILAATLLVFRVSGRYVYYAGG